MLNRAATDKLLALIRRCSANPTEFTIVNHADMNKQWEKVSKKCTEVRYSIQTNSYHDRLLLSQFQKYDVAVPYKGVYQIFEMHARPLWNWSLDLIQDPRLAAFFVWDAERVYKYNGLSFIRFYTEPWTAEALWDIQVCVMPLYYYYVCSLTGNEV